MRLGFGSGRCIEPTDADGRAERPPVIFNSVDLTVDT
jgi:hypothetical protein